MNAPQLWAADPNQFGPGKTHAIDFDHEEPGRTYCGKLTAKFPGRPVTAGKVTCKVCCDAPARRAQAEQRWAESRVRWDAEEREREAAKAQADAEWRRRYDAHMVSPKWRTIRAKVIARAGAICEGCASAPAVQAHHMTYVHMGDEFLWELKAVCKRCHDRFHADSSH